jgi:hypothetical protein
MVGIFLRKALSSRGQNVVEDVGRLFQGLDHMAHMRAHERIGVRLFLQRYCVNPGYSSKSNWGGCVRLNAL